MGGVRAQGWKGGRNSTRYKEQQGKKIGEPRRSATGRSALGHQRMSAPPPLV